ncbi:hypothetical protein DFH09DRAFT_1435061 [Mycena vulgaris]|nr:hypothetical protein DFH09DRAFT_1435061 [Mycena vulgaris]
MTATPSSALGTNRLPSAMGILDSAILPALRLATAGATGIGVPGVEGALNGVLELAEMVSTMKANKEDLGKLDKNLGSLIANIKASGATGELKQRLDKLSSELERIGRECKSLMEKRGPQRFFKAKDHKESIKGITDSVADQIRQFTFYGNISIEKSVGGILK